MEMSEYVTTRKDALAGWVRKFSLFPYPFVTACCGMEFMSVSSTLYAAKQEGYSFASVFNTTFNLRLAWYVRTQR